MRVNEAKYWRVTAVSQIRKPRQRMGNLLRRWCEEPQARLSGLEVVGCCSWWFGSFVVVVSVVKMVGDVCWLWFYSLPNYWMLSLVEFCVVVEFRQ